MKEKMPWFVRLNSHIWDMDYIPTRKEKIKEILITLAFFILAGVIGYGIFCFKSAIPYEQAYDVEYSTYVNKRLEEVAEEVLDKSIGINLSKIPEVVSKYEIRYAQEVIEFNYWLDKEQVVSEYYSKTGKMPRDDDQKKSIEMNIKISTNFQNVSMLTSTDTLPTKERYENKLPEERMMDITLYSIQTALVFLLAWAVVLISISFLAWVWKIKNTNNPFIKTTI